MATALTAQALESGPCGHTAVSSQAGHPTPTTPMSFSIKCEQWRCIFHGWLQTLNEIIHREAPEQSLWAEHTLHQHWALFPSWVVCVCVCVWPEGQVVWKGWCLTNPVGFRILIHILILRLLLPGSTVRFCETQVHSTESERITLIVKFYKLGVKIQLHSFHMLAR